jgi:hypothetical protein
VTAPDPKPISAKRLAESEAVCDLISALLYERARANAAEARLSALTEAAQAVDDAWMQDTNKLALPAAIQRLRQVRRAALEK